MRGTSMNAYEVRSLKTGYEDKIIIPDLSISIRQGAITTIIGENGCGKSTLLKTLGRILHPMEGEVLVKGQNVHKTSTREIAKIIGLLPQSPKAPNGLTVSEIVEYGRFPHKHKNSKMTPEDLAVIEESLEKTNLLDLKDRAINSLSGGQRQRVWIAMVLAQQTDIILLDEPTTYLDMAYQLEVLNLVRELNHDKGVTVIMVLHDINLASRFSDELIMMRKGQVIAQGPPRTTMTHDNLKKVFDVDATLIDLPGSNIPVCISYEVLRT